MKYTVLLEQSDEGFAVRVPELPGCHSQGTTLEEAIQNIRDAIGEYLQVAADLGRDTMVHEVDAGVPELSSVNHLDAVRALEKAGFHMARQDKDIIMTDGTRLIAIPRHDPVNAITMGHIVRDAGLTNEQFRRLI